MKAQELPLAPPVPRCPPCLFCRYRRAGAPPVQTPPDPRKPPA